MLSLGIDPKKKKKKPKKKKKKKRKILRQVLAVYRMRKKPGWDLANQKKGDGRREHNST